MKLTTEEKQLILSALVYTLENGMHPSEADLDNQEEFNKILKEKQSYRKLIKKLSY